MSMTGTMRAYTFDDPDVSPGEEFVRRADADARIAELEAKVARVEALAEVWDERNYPGMIGISKRIRAALKGNSND